MLPKSPALAFVGLLATGLVALALVQGSMTITTAATRLLVVTAALVGVDRFVLPFARSLVHTGQRDR